MAAHSLFDGSFSVMRIQMAGFQSGTLLIFRWVLGFMPLFILIVGDFKLATCWWSGARSLYLSHRKVHFFFLNVNKGSYQYSIHKPSFSAYQFQHLEKQLFFSLLLFLLFHLLLLFLFFLVWQGYWGTLLKDESRPLKRNSARGYK